MIRTKRLGIAGGLAFAAVLAAGTTFVFASEPSATEDCYATGSPLACFSGSATATGTNTTNLVFTVGNLKDTCTFSQAIGKPPAAGLKPFTIHGPNTNLGSGPQFSDGTAANPTACQDSLGGQDTTTTSGTWKIQEKDGDGTAGESSAEPNATGDSDIISVPLNGAVVTNTLGCTIVVDPDASTGTPFPNSKPFKVKGKYDDSNTLTVSVTNIPVFVTGPAVCPDTTSGGANKTAAFTGTYHFSPNVTDKS